MTVNIDVNANANASGGTNADESTLSIPEALAILRAKLRHVTRDYRPEDRALDVLTKHFTNNRPVSINPALHAQTAALVRDFATALANKLAAAELKYGYGNGWVSPHWMNECRAQLRQHTEKGDPLDVAAYAAFLWYHKASTRDENCEAPPS